MNIKNETSKHHLQILHQKSLKHEFDDAKLFCDDCNKFYDNICPYHKQSYIPDKKVCFNFYKKITNI